MKRIAMLVLVVGGMGCTQGPPPIQNAPAAPSIAPDVWADTARGVVCYSYHFDGYDAGRTISCVAVRQ